MAAGISQKKTANKNNASWAKTKKRCYSKVWKSLCVLVSILVVFMILYVTGAQQDTPEIDTYSDFLMTDLINGLYRTTQTLRTTLSAKLQLVDNVPSFPVAEAVLFSTKLKVSVICFLIGIFIMWCWMEKQRGKYLQKTIAVAKRRPKTTIDSSYHSLHVFGKMSTRIIIISAVASVPWEWIRMYQNEVAKKASTLYQGVPAECLPQDIGVWLSIKSWLSWQFTWGHDPCYKYHHALIVDPVWEVTPVMAVCAAVTRCLTKPLEIIATGVGQSLQRLFTEIPSPWQPVILISVLLITVLFLIMICNYRFSIPLFMSLEPKRRDMPPRRRSSRIKAANSTNKYNNLSLCATPKNKRIVDN